MPFRTPINPVLLHILNVSSRAAPKSQSFKAKVENLAKMLHFNCLLICTTTFRQEAKI